MISNTKMTSKTRLLLALIALGVSPLGLAAHPAYAQNAASTKTSIETPPIAPEKTDEKTGNKTTKAITPAGKVFNARSMTLENGLQVVVVENNRVPVVTHMIWYRTGAADEPRGKSGIAHFMEHLMFKGSEGLEPGEFSRIVRNLGGNDNAFTSQDYTAYFQSIAAEHLERVMTMEAGRMRGMNPPEAEVLSERKVILEERRQRTDNNPRAQFSESLNAALFVNHPYGTPIIGWAHEMEGLNRQDAMDFYNKWYGPNNAILVVSGDVQADEVFALAQKIYGDKEKIELPPRTRTISPPLVGTNILEFKHSSIRQPIFQRLFKAPSARQNKQDSLALQVLEDIVGSGPTSRLYRALVIEQKLATSAGLSYNGSAWDNGTISVYASPAEGVDMDTLEKALSAEIEVLIRDGVREEELTDSLTRLQAEAIYARDSLSGPAMIIGYALATGSNLDDIEYWPQDISRVTAAQIQDVAAKYLDINADGIRYVTGYLLPQDAPEKSQEKLEPETPSDAPSDKKENAR